MELKIYDKQGLVKMTVSPDNSSQWNHEVGVENVVMVNFTTWEFLVLEVGWYILVENQKFSIKSEYRPKHIHNTKYTYNLKFYGREHDAQDILFCRLNQGEDDLESVFAQDGTPMDFLQKVVANMNRNTEGVVWKAGEAISVNRKTINFNGLYCWDALNEISRTFGTEWWMDGEYLNISKCERGEYVSLGYGQGLKSGLTQNENTNAVKWFTRLIPVGSSKNIDKNKYGYSNLQLPGREKYIDINSQYGLKEYREEAAFSEIYPHRVGTISSVRSETRTNEETGEYTVFFVKDTSLPFNPDEYMIGGEVIHMSFNSGDLAGKDFEINWNNVTKEFEIINQYPDVNTQLPGGNLVPNSDDEYVLWNISMPDEYIRAAEQEYKEAVDAYLAEYSKDISIYSGNTDYIYIDQNNVPLLLGQRVRLLSEIYFGNIGRDSRISRVSRKLNNLSEATIDCSNAIAASWKSSVDSSLNQLQFSVAKDFANTIIDILKTGDSEEPSNYNVLSSLRSLNTFLRKDKDDRSRGIIASDKGVEVGRFTTGMVGGYGAKLYMNENGKAVLETDKIQAREELIVPTITFNTIEVVSGDKANTFAFGRIKEVNTELQIAELDLLEDEYGTLKEYDILRGVFHNIEGGNDTETREDENGFMEYSGFFTSYFSPSEILVSEAGRMSFRYTLQEGSKHPCAGMNFYAYGNFIDNERQSITYENRDYRRRLVKMNSWDINPTKNIVMQDGKLDHLVIGGFSMSGYGTFQTNSYFTGVQIQFTPDQLEDLKGEDAYSVNLSSYEGFLRVNGDGEVVSGMTSQYNVVTGSMNVTTQGNNVVTTDFCLKTVIQASRGSTPLFYSTEVGKGSFIASIRTVGCQGYISSGAVVITDVFNLENCYVTIIVNCEGGKHHVELEYRINAVYDGKSFEMETIYSKKQNPKKPEEVHPYEDDEDWSHEISEDNLWMATASQKNNEWTKWQVTRIKGFDGFDYKVFPESISIGRSLTGSLSPSSVMFTCYRVEAGEYIEADANWSIERYDGTAWNTTNYTGSKSTTLTYDFPDNGPYSAYRFIAVPVEHDKAKAIGTASILNEGVSGQMPRYRGIWKAVSESDAYVWDETYRDIVIHEGQAYQVASLNLKLTTQEPSKNSEVWNQASKFDFVAMDTALIDGAHIAGFTFKDNKMVSTYKTDISEATLVLDGESGEIVAKSGTIGGFRILNSSIDGSWLNNNGEFIESKGVTLSPHLIEITNGEYGRGAAVRLGDEDYAAVEIGTEKIVGIHVASNGANAIKTDGNVTIDGDLTVTGKINGEEVEGGGGNVVIVGSMSEVDEIKEGVLYVIV